MVATDNPEGVLNVCPLAHPAVRHLIISLGAAAHEADRLMWEPASSNNNAEYRTARLELLAAQARREVIELAELLGLQVRGGTDA